MSAILLKWPPQWRIQWHDVFVNAFSEIYAPENLYIRVDNDGSRPLSFRDNGDIEAIFKMAAKGPTGEIWLGIIAQFTFFGVMYMCAKFCAFTTKCTIHSYLVT